MNGSRVTAEPMPDSPAGECKAATSDASGVRISMPGQSHSPSSSHPPRGSAAALRRCQQRIGYRFRNPALLRQALMHASGAPHRLASNERLEFLGDAILGLVVSELLYHHYPKELEGELTRIKSIVVSRRVCAKIARMIGLDEFLLLGKGMQDQRRLPPSLAAGAFESLVAAIYLDGGHDAAATFIRRFLLPEIETAAQGDPGGNYKSLLQQIAQREYGTVPNYLVMEEKGPDHHKSFKIQAQIQQRLFPPAWGRNKKEAEQRAALNALSALEGKPIPFEE